MNSIKYRITLDMHSTQSQVSIPVMKNDTGRRIYIILSDGGNPYTIADGCLAKFSVHTPSGREWWDFCIIERNTTIVYDFTDYTAAEEGLNECDVTLYGSDGRIVATPRFALVVSERVTSSGDNVSSEEVKETLDLLLLKENERQNAEIERVEAEAARQEAHEEAIKNVDEAIERANYAAENIAEGKSAYEIDVKHGYTGTEAEWLRDVRGDFDEKLEQAKEEVAATVTETVDQYIDYIDGLIGDGTTGGEGFTLDELIGRVTKLESEPTSITIASSESSMEITEAYGDETRTTTVQLDDNGNPVAITDGDGNVVTTLKWGSEE